MKTLWKCVNSRDTFKLSLIDIQIVARSTSKGATWWSDQNKKNTLLLKFKNLLKKKKNNKGKHSRHLGKCHNYGNKVIKQTSVQNLRKPRISKGSNSGTKFAKELWFTKSIIKSKEEALEFKVEGEVMNVVEEEMKDNKAKESGFFWDNSGQSRNGK